MKKFSFGLQNVLDYWTYVEEAEKLQLQRLLAELRQTEEKVAQLETIRLESSSRWRQRTRVFPHEIHTYRNYLAHLDIQLNRLSLAASNLDQSIQHQRKTVVQASRQRKLLEGLKARKLERYLVDLRRFEQQQVDELFLARRARRETAPA